MKFPFISSRLLLLISLLLVLLTACGTGPHGQTFPEAPPILDSSESENVISNYLLKQGTPLAFGLPVTNTGTTQITLDSLSAVEASSSVQIFATGVVDPDKEKMGLPIGGTEYPPINDKSHKPFVIQPLKGTIVPPGAYREILVVLKSSSTGISVAKGFLLTVIINGQTYQRYYYYAGVLCIDVSEKECSDAHSKVKFDKN